MTQPAVFLDRDGVLNRAVVRNGVPHPPQKVEEIEILPGVEATLVQLAELDVPLIVVTNQPDVARGTQTRERVEAMNQWLKDRLPLTAIYVCYHDSQDECACRKPKAGLLIEAARAHDVDLSASFMVGDRWSDIAAGQAAGCRTLLIEQLYSQAERCEPWKRAKDLPQAVEIILDQLRESQSERWAARAR
jgi:D-glycero-D-manno-heptose 1,7-bisphosphate phosphatase